MNNIAKENSRTKNAMLNVFYGYIAQIGILILSFVGRRIFLLFLSADYLGINGLYSNILTLLSLAELGLDTAVVYSLYKPVAEHDYVKIASLLEYFKKIYYVLAVGILIIGGCLVPFLKFLVTSDLQECDLIAYYLLFLINSVASYFVAHKIALLSACQQQRIQKTITLSVNFLLQASYIVVLFVWKNYYAYVIAMVCSTFLTNVILSTICSKIHPEIFECKERVDIDKNPILKRVGSTFLYKLGGVIVTSTDNILISVLVSTLAVGYYSNYYTVVSAVQGFISIVTTSMVAGIGNLAVNASNKKQEELFDMMVLFYHLVGAMGLIGFSLLFNNLITIWLGGDYLFDNAIVFIVAFNFYLTNAISPVWMFREANGLFDKVKFILLIRAVFNLVLSILFGIMWGVFGIFAATALSLIMTNFWLEPKIVSKEILKRKQSIYWFKQTKYCIVTMIAYVCAFLATFKIGDTLGCLIIKAVMICVITSVIFIVVNRKTPELLKLKGYLRR